MSRLREPASLAKACDFLAGEGWLATSPPDFRDAFLALGFLRTFAPGDQISTAGDDATTGPGMYGVAAGQVAVQSTLGALDTPVSLLFNPGNWGGYAPLFGRTRVAHLRAIIATTILCVRIGDIRRLLAARPEWWQHFALLGFEAGMNYATVAVDLLLQEPKRRLAAMLLHQAGCRHRGEAWPVHLSHAELGETARLSRHPTRQLLRDFEAQGWISRNYCCIRVLAPPPLRMLAETGETMGKAG